MGFLMRIVINTVLFVAIAGFFAQSGSFYVASVGTAFVASLVLAILNAFVRPILFILSLPITVFTLGLFSVILNAIMLQLTSTLVGTDSFRFSSFGITILIAIIISIFNTIILGHLLHRD